jgi:uncharacterized membrane protein SpoIIM required for sporulation
VNAKSLQAEAFRPGFTGFSAEIRTPVYHIKSGPEGLGLKPWDTLRPMDLNDFLHQRRPRWDRLAAVLDRIERGGVGSLKSEEVEELFALYRLVSSDLNLVQTRTGNPAVVEYLEALVARAYASLAVPKRSSFFSAWWMILRNYFPATVRAHGKLVAISASALIAGVLLGFGGVMANPEFEDILVPAEHMQQRPADRVAELEERERTGQNTAATATSNINFSAFLTTHNIQCTIIGFALGITFGIGTIIVLFTNGIGLGALAALYLQDHVFTFFLAWVGPHGAFELTCIVVGCTAGLLIAQTQYRKNEGTVLRQIRRLRPTLIDLLVGSATFLIAAGAIEGGFSQVNEPTIPYWFKITVAVVFFVSFMAYLFFIPVKARPVAIEE